MSSSADLEHPDEIGTHQYLTPKEIKEFFFRQNFIYMPFIVYILFSSTKNKFYIGYTSQLEERINRHNQKSNGFTENTNDWKIVYTETYLTKSEALAREKQIKSWKSKIKIQKSIPLKSSFIYYSAKTIYDIINASI